MDLRANTAVRLHSIGHLLCGTMVFPSLLRDGEAGVLLPPPHQVSWRIFICAAGTNKFGKQKTPIFLLASLSVFLIGHDLISLYSYLCREASSPCPLLPFLQLCSHSENHTDCRTQANTRTSLLALLSYLLLDPFIIASKVQDGDVELRGSYPLQDGL